MAEPAETSSSSDHTAAHNLTHENLKQYPEPKFSGFPAYPNAHLQMFPVLFPTIVPEVTSLPNQQQINGGAGIYAVPVSPFNGPIAGLPTNTLIPLTFSIPTTPPPEAGSAGDHGEQPQHQQQAPAPHRQVAVRRFQIAFQLDLFLILKLAAVIFLFNQDGSRQRLVVLVLFASLVYLYQTGALTPLVRWLSQSMQRAAAPPRPPRAAARAENDPAVRQNENAPLAGGGGEEENRAGVDGNQGAENENVEGGGGDGHGGNRWWGIVKEVQMIVFGFITSLLPGFHNID
ncbi:unnamed protein product [Linum tenue]|uniref:Transmembrane protein n=1 Tax=Linum tenue TaxID=586396 RepID=A0AAV0L2H3_9ROSI|nr:unnamed protein product [Linum tenue]